MTTTDLALLPHPLDGYEPHEAPIYNWQQWLAAWGDTPYEMARLGLLHGAFDIEVADPEERICFFLRLADGWAVRGIANADDPKNALVRMAADVLARRFFNERFTDDVRASAWGTELGSDEVLGHLAWFLRPDPGSISPGTNVCNLPHPNIKGAAPIATRKFARRLAQLVWRFQNGRWLGRGGLPYQLREVLPTLRPDFLHVLLAFDDDLELLLHRDCDVDVASRMRLHELALDRRYVLSWEQLQLPENQAPWSCLQEAAHNGSRAARVALLLGMDDEFAAG